MGDIRSIQMAGSKDKVRELYDALMDVKNRKGEAERTVYFREAMVTIWRSPDDDSLVMIQVDDRNHND